MNKVSWCCKCSAVCLGVWTGLLSFGPARDAEQNQVLDPKIPAQWRQPLEQALQQGSPTKAHEIGERWIKADKYSRLSLETMVKVYLELDAPALAYHSSLSLRMIGDELPAHYVAKAMLRVGQPEAAHAAASRHAGLQGLSDQAMAESLMQRAYGDMLARLGKLSAGGSADASVLRVLWMGKLGMEAEAQSLAEEAIADGKASSDLLRATAEQGRVQDKAHVRVFQKLVESRLAQARQVLAGPKATLLDSDWLLLSGQLQAPDWKQREALCRELKLDAEAHAALAQYVALSGEDAARARFDKQRKQAATMTAEIKQMAERGERAEAFRRLEAARALDPVSHELLLLGYELAVAASDDLHATDCLRQWWRAGGSNWWSHPNPRFDPKQGMEVAARAGDWPLLFSLALEKTGYDCADHSSNHHAYLASIALGYSQREVFGKRVEATPYEVQSDLARTLLWLPSHKRKGKPVAVTLQPLHRQWTSTRQGRLQGLELGAALLKVRADWPHMPADKQRQQGAHLAHHSPTGVMEFYGKYALHQINRTQLEASISGQAGENVVRALLLLEDEQPGDDRHRTAIVETQYDPLLPAELKAVLHFTLMDQGGVLASPLRLEDSCTVAWASPAYCQAEMPGLEKVVSALGGISDLRSDRQNHLLKRRLQDATDHAMRKKAVAIYGKNMDELGKAKGMNPQQTRDLKAETLLRLAEADQQNLVYDLVMAIDGDVKQVKPYIARLAPAARKALKRQAQNVVTQYEETHSYGDEIYKSYPPGSPYYEVVRASMRKGDSMAQLKAKLDAAYQQEVADHKRKVAAWKAAQAERQRRAAEHQRQQQEYQRQQQEYNRQMRQARAQEASRTYYSSYRSQRNSYSSSYSLPPSWESKWSDSYRNSVYRNQVDQQIRRAMGGY